MFNDINFLNPEYLYLLILIPFLVLIEMGFNKNRTPSIIWSSSFLISKTISWKLVLKYLLWLTRGFALAVRFLRKSASLCNSIFWYWYILWD